MPDDPAQEETPRRVSPGRTRRRIRTDPPPGTDPHPEPEAERSAGTENDYRLRADKPPHY